MKVCGINQTTELMDPMLQKAKMSQWKKAHWWRESPHMEYQDPVATNSHRTEPKAETKKPTRRGKVKWPKSCETGQGHGELWTLTWPRYWKDLCKERWNPSSNRLGMSYIRPVRTGFGEATSNQRTTQREKGRREKEIDLLARRRRQLRKNWRKAMLVEKKGLKALWEEVRQRLPRLCRAERIHKRSKRKQKEQASFFKDPFKPARQLLEEKKSGKLKTTREKLEQHVKEHYSDPVRNVPLGTQGYVPKPAPQTAVFNIMPPKLSEVRQVVEMARSSSVPGANGIPYKLYKNYPKVLDMPWYFMRTAWKKQLIQFEWQRAVAVFIPKEVNSKDISQFRNIALLNVEGKSSSQCWPEG